jgi:hypothetical protein|tara:strand:+ start:2797 stop:3456 length:660 start_codon:yes stop_codon:yes gene_type:complete
MIIPIFQHNIYKYKVNPLTFDKNKIISTIEKNFKKKYFRNKFDDSYPSESKIHHSLFDNDNKDFNEPNYSSLEKEYKKIFHNFISEIKFKPNTVLKYNFKIMSYTCTNKDHFMKKHYHLPSDFSCIHYLQYDEEHSPTLFYNPSEKTGRYLQSFKNKYYKSLDFNHEENLGISVFYENAFMEDDIIIFPGYLEHEIPISKKLYKRNRITIVTNINIEIQ